MFSITLILVSIICIVIIIFLYNIIIYQKPETPEDVYARLVNVNLPSITSFTYAKRGDLYENYTIPVFEDNKFKLIKSLDKYPVKFDGTNYIIDEYTHGNMTVNDNGFKISGLNFTFECPPQYSYLNGKCVIDDLCQDGDNNIYRGINYYYFNERILNNSVKLRTFEEISNENKNLYHQRLYMHCKNGKKDTELKVCASNELFRQKSEINGNFEKACQLYDVCEDKMELVKHQNPIDNRGPLNVDEYFICRGGVSHLGKCPVGTIFNNEVNACTSEFICEDNDVFSVQLNAGNILRCRNGIKSIQTCLSGKSFKNTNNNHFECLDVSCSEEKQINYVELPHARFPYGYSFCRNNEMFNTTCFDTVLTRTLPNIIYQQVNIPYRQTKPFFNNDIELPLLIYNIEIDDCKPANDENLKPYLNNIIIKVSYNLGLPDLPYNFATKTFDYSTYDEFVFLNQLPVGTKAIGNAGNELLEYTFVNDEFNINKIINNGKFAPFITTVDLNMWLYNEDVTVRNNKYKFVGDLDGVTYQVVYLNPNKIKRNNSVPYNLTAYFNTEGNIIQIGTENMIQGYWNAYTQTISDIKSAHADHLFNVLPFYLSYVFQYKIVAYEINNVRYEPQNNYTEPQEIPIETTTKLFMGIWTEYGLIEIECNPLENVFINWNNKNVNDTPQFILTHKTLPDFNNEQHQIDIERPRNFTIVTPLRNKLFHYRHIPLCFQFVQNWKIISPPDAIDYSIEEIFKVNHNEYYQNFIEI